MLNDDQLSDCCEAPYRLKERPKDDIWPNGGPYNECSVCGKPCGLVAFPEPRPLEINVQDTIQTKEHLS